MARERKVRWWLRLKQLFAEGELPTDAANRFDVTIAISQSGIAGTEMNLKLYLSSRSFLLVSLVVRMLPEVIGLSGGGGLTNRRDACESHVSFLAFEMTGYHETGGGTNLPAGIHINFVAGSRIVHARVQAICANGFRIQRGGSSQRRSI